MTRLDRPTKRGNSPMRPYTIAPIVCLLTVLLAGAAPTPIAVAIPAGRKEPVSYSKDVADILGGKCVGCHGVALAENKLNLEEVPAMLKGGKRGPALVPGKADQSLLFTMSSHRVEPVMPPKDKKDAKPLTPEELGVLKLWIDAGAKDDSEETAAAATPVQLGELPPGVQPINAVDMTADGERVACGRANVVQVYDASSGLEILSLGGHKDLIQSIRFSPDGHRLAAGSYQIVTVWNLPTGGLKATLAGHGDQVKAVVALPDGSVISGGLDRTIRFWDPAGKPTRQVAAPAPVFALAVSPDGKRLAVGGPDNLVHVLSAADGKEIVALKGHGGAVNGVAFLRSGGDRLVSASADGSARLWTVPAKPEDKPIDPTVLAGHKGPVHAVAGSSDGKLVVTAGEDGAIRGWDAASGKPIGASAPVGAPLLCLAISPKGDRVLAGSADKSARLFDLPGMKVHSTLGGHGGPVHAVAFSPDGSRMATAGAEGGVKVWDAETARGVIAFGHTAPNNTPIQPILAVTFNGPGSLVTASADKTLKTWEFSGQWSEMKPLGPHADRVLALDFNPDGSLLAAGGGEPSRSGEIKVWEVGKGLPVRTLDNLHSDTVFGLRYSPDGSKLASVGADKFLKVSRGENGKELRSFEGHTSHVLAVDWNSDGKQIVTGGADNVIKIWDADSGEQVRTLQAAGKQVTSVRWLTGKPDVAGASGDKLVRFWNASTGGVSKTFAGPGDYVFGVAVSKDGARVAAGGADGVLFLWDGRNGQVLRKIDPPVSKAVNNK